MDKITDFYTNTYNENNRLGLTTDRRHRVEREIKQRVFMNHIPANSKILDISCGTGVHTIFLMKQGHDLTACDLVESHIDQLNANIKDANLPTIQTDVCNALNLPYTDNEFDVILLSGAIYHLSTIEDKLTAILEAKRVCKDNGLIFIDFLPYEHGFIQMMLKYPDFLENADMFKSYGIGYKQDNIFSFDKYHDLHTLLVKICNLNIKYAIGTDSITRFINGNIDLMSDVVFEKYLDYIEEISYNHHNIDLSEHAMIICEK